jgi:hypothetical protein
MMTGPFTTTALREVLNEVERDEAAAIQALCALLERAEESRDFGCLTDVRKVLIEWQNRPPGVIVSELAKISQELEKNA